LKPSTPKEKPAALDDFAELLEAIITPNSSKEKGPLSRLPLSSVDENVRAALPITTATTVNSNGAESNDADDSCSGEDGTKISLHGSVDTSATSSKELVQVVVPKATHLPLSKQEIYTSIMLQLRHYSQFEHQHQQALSKARY